MYKLKKGGKFSTLSSLWLWVVSVTALISAYSAQYFFDMEPCKLCIYQRIPYMVIVFIVPLIFVFKMRIIYYLALICMIIEIVLAAHHTGVELGIFELPQFCNSSIQTSWAESLEDLEQQLRNAKLIRCDQVLFTFLGLSMAMWNTLYSLFCVLLALFIDKKYYGKKY